MPDLAQLFNHYGSDKDVNGGYAQLYTILLEPVRLEIQTLLEIGIGTMVPGARSSMVGYALPGYRPGGSLRAWRDFLPNAKILGIDVQPDTIFTEERISTFLVDSTDNAKIRALGWPRLDVIIDDGSHRAEDQLSTLRNFWPLLVDNGLYVIEDIFLGNAMSEHPELIEEIVGRTTPFFFVGHTERLCVLKKTCVNTSRRVY